LFKDGYLNGAHQPAQQDLAFATETRVGNQFSRKEVFLKQTELRALCTAPLLAGLRAELHLGKTTGATAFDAWPKL